MVSCEKMFQVRYLDHTFSPSLHRALQLLSPMGSEEAAEPRRYYQSASSWVEARRIILRHAARTVLPTVWRMCFFTVGLASSM